MNQWDFVLFGQLQSKSGTGKVSLKMDEVDFFGVEHLARCNQRLWNVENRRIFAVWAEFS